MSNPADEISQTEKRRIMIEEHRAKTYHGHAMDADLEMGGRYAKVHSTTVVGSGPVQYPAQPLASPWHHDPCPPEPPLGYSVDDVEPVGEVHERGPPSIAAAPDVDVSGGPSDGDVSATSFNKPSRLWRRF